MKKGYDRLRENDQLRNIFHSYLCSKIYTVLLIFQMINFYPADKMKIGYEEHELWCNRELQKCSTCI
jgi:hypothetical protein